MNLFQHIKTAWRLRNDFARLQRMYGNSCKLKIQFGCGPNIIPGWVNTDIVPQAAESFALDVRNPLPFPAGSADFIFSEHFIEHLAKGESVRFLTECLRVLSPGGVIRIGWPELSNVLTAYFHSSPETWDTGNPASETMGDKVNDSFYLYDHRYLYDYKTLELAMTRIGFINFTKVPWGESEHPELKGIEKNLSFRVHVIEAEKPKV
jgi:predicted SAM-dependent methyltransferase